MKNELKGYGDVLQAAHESRFRKWRPKLEYLAKQISIGKMPMPKDPQLRSSLLAMKENRQGPIMSTIDSNVRMLANAVWDAKEGNS